MPVKYLRDTKEYALAEKIVFLEDALDRANKILNNKGMFGVLPSTTTSFENGQTHHKKVRETLSDI